MSFITELITCITIGYGTIAPVHHDKLSSCNVKPVGIIETNVAKHDAIRNQGFHVCDSYEEAAQLNPGFWDICCPVDDHVAAIERIMAVDPQARIIVEKPICNFEEIPKLHRLL
jgi:Oxidoreductase family, NAD-binding Rossmann fold